MILTHLLSILILMQIISITLVQFVAIAEDDENCLDDEECRELQYCPAADYMAKRIGSGNVIKYCLEDGSRVCCPKDNKEHETISEKKCMDYTKIDNFCPKTPLIKDGNETIPHQFPFMVAVKETSSKTDWICGGALISSNYVLTAAHCFDEQTNDKNYSVILGAHERSSNNSIEIKVDITIHSEYQKGYFADIALLKLHNETNFTENIKPVCLPRKEEHEKHEYYATGWGYVSGTKRPNVLLMGPMVAANCSKPGNIADTDKFDPKSQICAGPKNPLGDVCTYDSGGPLFTSYAGYDNCLSEIFGVVSGGGNCDLKRSTSRYAKVFFFRKWIEEIVWPEEVQKN